MHPKTELMIRRIDPDETLEMCPACLRRAERATPRDRRKFRVGELRNGFCHRCGYRSAEQRSIPS